MLQSPLKLGLMSADTHKPSAQVQILRTCKQIYHEGRIILFTKTEFPVWPDDYQTAFMPLHQAKRYRFHSSRNYGPLIPIIPKSWGLSLITRLLMELTTTGRSGGLGLKTKLH